MADVWSVDPRSGKQVRLVGATTSAAETDVAARKASRAAGELVTFGRPARAALLRAVASVVDSRADELIAIAQRETALDVRRLTSELARTTGQLRLFGDVVQDGSYQEAILTAAQPQAEPPVPDLRRMLIPLGPVVVFGASNFPFAFSVLGGDTVAALAAGCPVLVKCHSGHPETSSLMMDVWRDAAAVSGAPQDALQLVFGRSAGRQLVEHPDVRAVSFTGSLAVGRELHDLAAGRPHPVPFYGELAGVNPLIVTIGAARERGEDIGREVAASFTLGGGQFCTKPGLLFVPAGPDGDRLVAAAAAYVAELAPGVMLTEATGLSYQAGLKRMLLHPRVATIASAAPLTARAPNSADGGGPLGTAALLEVSLKELDGSILQETFGPMALTVRYESISDVLDVLYGLEGALAAAIHSIEEEAVQTAAITAAVLPKVGRVVYNGYPTGVSVTAAMTHGGPWPATTNSLHSGVGPTAIRRFLRPVTYQDAPRSVLPVELRD